MIKYVLATLAVLTSSSARASDWRLVSTSPVGDQFYLDFSSVAGDYEMRTIWEKVIKQNPDKNGAAYSVGHWEFHCPGRTIVLLSNTEYQADGTVITSQVVPTYRQQTDYVAPDTVAETLYNLVCRLSSAPHR
jgi:hypothetical protein